MNNFTKYLTESRKKTRNNILNSSDLNRFVSKLQHILPSSVKKVIYLTDKNKIYDRSSLEEIRNSLKGSLSKLSSKYDISSTDMEDLWFSLNDLKNLVKLLPQYMTSYERDMMEKGNLSVNDILIDLDSPQGRKAAASTYMPLVYKIINSYIGKSDLSKNELMSAALTGMTGAMNDWKRDSDNDNENTVSFKTYVGYRVKQQILHDINQYGHTLSGFNDYARKHGYNADALSLDSLLMNYDDNLRQDRLAFLGDKDEIDDDYILGNSSIWKEIYKIIEAKFKQRDYVTFYRTYGLNGYEREPIKNLAKELNISTSAVHNSILSKILKFLRGDKKAMKLLSDIRDSYNESLMLNLLGMDKDIIIETLLNDDMYILLEELNRWSNKGVFVRYLNTSLNNLTPQENEYIINILKGNFEDLDSTYKPNKNTIIKFLSGLYPTKSFKDISDVSILEEMTNICDIYKKFEIN